MNIKGMKFRTLLQLFTLKATEVNRSASCCTSVWEQSYLACMNQGAMCGWSWEHLEDSCLNSTSSMMDNFLISEKPLKMLKIALTKTALLSKCKSPSFQRSQAAHHWSFLSMKLKRDAHISSRFQTPPQVKPGKQKCRVHRMNIVSLILNDKHA